MARHKATFIQIIKDNLATLRDHQYLTFTESGLLFSLSDVYELHTNAIANHMGEFLSITKLGKIVGITREHTSKTINSLIRKGIILEISDPYELREFGRPISKRPLFVNPEIIICGDRDRINPTLAKLTMQYDKLEEKGILLDWKVIYRPGWDHGKLVRRKTYLKYKKTGT